MYSVASAKEEEAVGLLDPATDFVLGDVGVEKLSSDMSTSKSRQAGFLSRWTCLIPYTATLIGRALLLFVPSFIQALYFGGKSPVDSHKDLRPTAFLDGLRGLAAWAVFNFHLIAVLVEHGGAAYGHGTPGHPWDNAQWWKIPIIRLAHNGQFAVSLFFVISGFAISISPVMSMRKTPRDSDVAKFKLSSAIFRRPIRLFLPSWTSMIITLILVRMGFFDYLTSRQTDFDSVFEGWVDFADWPTLQSTLYGQVADMVSNCAAMLEVFQELSDEPWVDIPYNGVLWTVKCEWRASLMLYATHAMLFYLCRRDRIIVACGLFVIGISVWARDYPLFLSGYLIAEISRLDKHEPRRGLLVQIGSWVSVLIGGYIGCFPGWEAELSPTHSFLLPYTPFGFFPTADIWAALGATLVVLGVRNLPAMIWVYESAPVQYLGKVSYSLYLVHYWIVQGVGSLVFYHTWGFTGRSDPFLEAVGFCIGYAVIFGMTIVLADIFMRVVDRPTVKFASWLQRRLFKER